MSNSSSGGSGPKSREEIDIERFRLEATEAMAAANAELIMAAQIGRDAAVRRDWAEHQLAEAEKAAGETAALRNGLEEAYRLLLRSFEVAQNDQRRTEHRQEEIDTRSRQMNEVLKATEEEMTRVSMIVTMRLRLLPLAQADCDASEQLSDANHVIYHLADEILEGVEHIHNPTRHPNSADPKATPGGSKSKSD